ncbi:hypothetical protein KFK09_022969 [Dendrobium nobile]|uniref:Asparagine synthetase domain-containing protein n=1 Tax=Dendrobium nobile TaxID=94219 RepID=A0A8T3AKV0_DENNO|nr:hypothetical protein KFK09_022969 [Dendrobium nobile]
MNNSASSERNELEVEEAKSKTIEKIISVHSEPAQRLLSALRSSVMRRSKIDSIFQTSMKKFGEEEMAPVAVLFSGGLDSMILSALLDQCLNPQYTKIPRCRSRFDTEFPGCIFRSSKHHTLLSPAERYSVLKLNADVIRPIQVGITISDGATSTASWQFELRDFDLRSHPHAPSSVALLESSGINLTRNRQMGIPSVWVARLLLDAGLVGDFSKATSVAFHGCCDFIIALLESSA